MTDMQLTDDHEIAARTAGHAQGVLALLDLITRDPTEQAAALITAASVVIERDVGHALAPSALAALIEPTMSDWTRRNGPAH